MRELESKFPLIFEIMGNIKLLEKIKNYDKPLSKRKRKITYGNT